MGLGGALQKDMGANGSLKCIVATLDLNVKSHKPDGDVKFRNIHCAASSPFKPAMRWMAEIFRHAMRDLPYILRDSDDLAEKMQRTQVEPFDKIVKADISDFFMSGKQSDLQSDGQLAAPESFRKAFGDMITFILGSQYIRVRGRNGVWKVVSGSGMGFLCSGELSDFVFYVII